MSFPAYPEYKDSGVAWLGEVPRHWDVKRLGFFFWERREKVSDVDYPPLSVTKSGIVPQLETAAKTDDNDNRKKVCSGDFVINSRSDRKGSSGVSELDGSVSLINTVLVQKEGIFSGYIHHLMRSVDFQEEFYRYGKGIVADLWSTNYSEMRDIVLAIPEVHEQHSIAAFLDHETAKIDALITEQEKLIELLKEKRLAVISHAVTRGLDPTVTMKDSGVEWLGQVPEHWKISSVKYLVESIEQGWSPQCENYPALLEGEWGVLKVGCVNGGTFNPQENKALPAELEAVPSLSIRLNDVLISRANTRELVGSTAVACEDYPSLLLCDKLYRLRMKKDKLFSHYFSFLMSTCAVRGEIESFSNGASNTMQNIGQSVILNLQIPVPPVDEQCLIVENVFGRLASLDALLNESQKAISLLKERRSALISAAVTGKIDVRGYAPQQEAV